MPGAKEPRYLVYGGDLAGQGQGEEGAAMEGVVEGDHARPAPVVARDLDGVLHGLGAGPDEQRLPLPPAGHDLIEPLGQLDVRLLHHMTWKQGCR